MPPRLAPDQLLLDRVVAKTAAYTAAVGDLVEANATSAGFTITLPSAPYTGARVTVKKTDSTGNVVTVVGQGGSTIDGDANASIVSQWAGATFVYDGTNWLVRSPTRDGGGGANYFRRDDFTIASPGADTETYTLAAAPIAGTVMAYVAGVLQPSSAVTVSGSTVTVTAHANIGDTVELTYWTQTPSPGASTMVQGMSPYPTAVMNSSPLAYWRLGEAAAGAQNFYAMRDSTSNGRTGSYQGTIYGAAGLLRDGSTDTCLQFSGSFGQVSSGTWMNPGSALTLEALINLDNTSSIHQIVDRDDGTSNRGFQWRVNSGGQLSLILFIGGAIPALVGATALVVGTTYHVAATYDGANMKVFVNGVQDGILAQTGAINTVTCPLRVGMPNNGSFPFAGRIDEVAMYGTVLSAATLLDHKTKSGI